MPEPLSAADLQERLGHSPLVAFLGLTVTHADARGLRARPGSGQWHGGPIAAAIDTVADYALAMLVGRPLPTIGFRVDYLRPAMRTGLTLTARVRRMGRSVGVVDVDILDERGAVVAIGRANYATPA